MKIVISGGLGFVGGRLTEVLASLGNRVTAIGSSKAKPPYFPDFSYISADASQSGSWLDEVAAADVVVNLAGRNIFHLWTKKYKQDIYKSRILTTRNIVKALPSNKPAILVSASAAGYYGDRGDRLLKESEPRGRDFLARVCGDWEKEALKAESKNVRTVILRLGVVLNKDGGVFKKMLPAYRFFLGGPLGGGKQWMPWIHMEDLVSVFRFILERDDVSGVFNACSPLPVRNADLSRTLAKLLKKPDFMKMPASLLKFLAGEFGASLLNSQRAVPDNLLKEGFNFKYPDLKKALSEILNR